MRVDDIATFQVGTHPALTASPIAYQITNAAEIALTKMR
jgi:NADH oxidase (H2O2-forming)